MCLRRCDVCVDRRVHISQSTKDCLHDGLFELEPGEGGDRCDYLMEKGIDTYLVLVPKEKNIQNGASNGAVSIMIFTLPG